MTPEEVKTLLVEMGKSHKEEMVAFAKTLVHEMQNPEKSSEEKKRIREALEQRIQLAKLEEEAKERRRRFCQSSAYYQANPYRPHTRDGAMHGMWNGTSTIIWRPMTFTYRDKDGRPQESAPVDCGICIKCGTTWTPDDPDYVQVRSLPSGPAMVSGQYIMNVRTGDPA